MLGKVSCGPDATGLIAFLNVLNEAVATFTTLAVQIRVQEPTAD